MYDIDYCEALIKSNRIFSKISIDGLAIRDHLLKLWCILRHIAHKVTALEISNCTVFVKDILKLLELFNNLESVELKEAAVVRDSIGFEAHSLSLTNITSFSVINNECSGPLDGIFLPIIQALPRNVLKKFTFHGTGPEDSVLMEILQNQKSVTKLEINVHGTEVPDLSSLKLTSLVISTNVANTTLNKSFQSIMRAIRSQQNAPLTYLNISSLNLIPIIFLDVIMLPHIQWLAINITDIPVEFLDLLTGLELKQLTVKSFGANAREQLEVLSQIRNEALKTLELEFEEISSIHLQNFHKNNPMISSIIVTVERNYKETVDTIFTCFNNVQVIDLIRPTQAKSVNQACNLSDYSCPSLTKSNLNTIFSKEISFVFNPTILKNFLRTLPNLEHLKLKGNKFNDQEIKTIIKELSCLKTLILDECQCKGKTLNVFRNVCKYGKWLESAQLYGISPQHIINNDEQGRFRVVSMQSRKPLLFLVPR